MLWELEQATEVMQWYREFSPSAPDDVNGFFAFLTVPPGPPFPEHLHNKKMCGVVWCYTARSTKRRKCSSRFAVLDLRPSIWWGRCLIPCSKACLMRFTRRATNGTGERTSSTN